MCHGSDLDFIRTEIAREEVEGLTVAEAGSLDINGSAREHIESLRPASYLGIDLTGGRGVNLIADAADLPKYGSFDLVVSTEMLEHAEHWGKVMRGMITAVKPGGVLFLTARGPGFHYHDFGGDYWRFSVDNMTAILKGAGLDIVICKPDPQHEGVFAKARKPKDWKWPRNTGWDKIILEIPKP